MKKVNKKMRRNRKVTQLLKIIYHAEVIFAPGIASSSVKLKHACWWLLKKEEDRVQSFNLHLQMLGSNIQDIACLRLLNEKHKMLLQDLQV